MSRLNSNNPHDGPPRTKVSPGKNQIAFLDARGGASSLVALLLILLGPQFASGEKQVVVTSAELVELVSTSLDSDHDDVRLAKQLEKVKMAERVSSEATFYFRNKGLGPKASAALEMMKDKYRSLEPPAEPPLTVRPIPSKEEQFQMLEHLSRYARDYVQGLPNFLCQEITKRYTNLHRFGPDWNPSYGKTFHSVDKLKVQLRFVDGSEDMRSTQNPTKKQRLVNTKRGQSLSMGEFGGDLAMIFEPDMSPAFNWDHWEVLRGKKRAVFSYFVGLPKSRFTLMFCCYAAPGLGEMQQTYKSAIRGLVYADPQSGLIVRLIIKAANLPPALHIKESNTVIDYDKVLINSREYTLPQKATLFSRSERQENRNEISFINYRKFDADSVVTFVESKIVHTK